VRIIDTMPVNDVYVEDGKVYSKLDLAVAQAARISLRTTDLDYKPEQAIKLVKTLFDLGHWSPFEQVVIKFQCKVPLFVAVQLIRYRSVSWNMKSGRYTTEFHEVYKPTVWRGKHPTNRQMGQGEVQLPEGLPQEVEAYLEWGLALHKKLAHHGVESGLARIVLPEAIFTEMQGTVNARMLVHLLAQRMAHDAQQETQEFARALCEQWRAVMPYFGALVAQQEGWE
jgi:thymidylate synthase (FAD)